MDLLIGKVGHFVRILLRVAVDNADFGKTVLSRTNTKFFDESSTLGISTRAAIVGLMGADGVMARENSKLKECRWLRPGKVDNADSQRCEHKTFLLGAPVRW